MTSIKYRTAALLLTTFMAAAAAFAVSSTSVMIEDAMSPFGSQPWPTKT